MTPTDDLNVPERARFKKALELLESLTGHIYCAASEKHADCVLCAGCKQAVMEAKRHLDIWRPGWFDRQCVEIKP